MSLKKEFVKFARAQGTNVSELCRRHGISRKTGYKWLQRYAQQGEEGLADRPRRPLHSPRQTPVAVAQCIEKARREHPAWGARKLDGCFRRNLLCHLRIIVRRPHEQHPCQPVAGEAEGCQNRWHFFSAAAEAMRRILIDRARSKSAERHGGRPERVDVEDLEISAPVEESELFEVHEWLDKFAAHHSQKAELVKLRYFAGLTLPEAAEVPGISTPTAERHWAITKVWLFREIGRRKGREG